MNVQRRHMVEARPRGRNARAPTRQDPAHFQQQLTFRSEKRSETLLESELISSDRKHSIQLLMVVAAACVGVGTLAVATGHMLAALLFLGIIVAFCGLVVTWGIWLTNNNLNY